MGMGWHNDKGIDPQGFMLVAKLEAFSKDEAGFVSDKNRQPVNNSKGKVIEGNTLLDAIGFHDQDYSGNSGKVARRDAGHSHSKTAPQQGVSMTRIIVGIARM